MPNKEAYQKGVDHYTAGLQLTPHDCRVFDKEVFSILVSNSVKLKLYNKLRGSFNRGFMAKYHEQTESLKGLINAQS